MVTNPQRDRPLQGNETIFALLPPATMANVKELKQVRVTQTAAPVTAAAAARSGAVPASAAAGVALGKAVMSSPIAPSKPPPIGKPPPSPPESPADDPQAGLRAELKRLTDALASVPAKRVFRILSTFVTPTDYRGCNKPITENGP